ncbi:MAG: MBL fold metallo-hydrolase [Candidatus Heimdallarchaeota archaeon]
MSYEKVTENVYAITDGTTRGNVCAFVLPSQIVFIDSGMHLPVLRKFREDLEKETGKKTSTLLITHRHGDHIYGNQVFSDCKIIAHKFTKAQLEISNEKEWTPEKIQEMIKSVEDPTSLEGLEIVLPTESFETKLEIEDFDVKLLYKNTGGHTKGCSYVYYPEAKALAVGDNLFNGMFPWGGDPSANPEVWLSALKQYLELDVEYIIPGHGPVCGKEGVTQFKEYLETVIVLMRKMITEKYSENAIVEKANAIEYPPPKREQWKQLSLKKWYAELSK